MAFMAEKEKKKWRNELKEELGGKLNPYCYNVGHLKVDICHYSHAEEKGG